MRSLHNRVFGFLSSQMFLYLIIFIFVVQALWIVFSFRFPMIYDEGNHFQLTAFFSEQLSPFVTSQSQDYDSLGAISTGANGIYHYLISLPLRVVTALTDSQSAAIIFLRVLNVGIFALGVWLYARLMQLIKIKQQYINIGILIFTLLPISTLLAAHISYDNMLFLLTALFMIFGVKALSGKRIVDTNTIWFISVGLFAVCTKLTFAPVLFAGVVYLLIAKLFAHKSINLKSSMEQIKKDVSQIDRKKLISASALGIISLAFLLPTYTSNYIRHKSLIPTCNQVLGIERCQANRFVVREERALATKDSRPIDLPNFPIDWYQRMTNFGLTGSKLSTAGAEWIEAPPLLHIMIANIPIVGLGILIYAWKTIKKTPGWYLLLALSTAILLSTFLFNLQVYMAYHQALASNPRYLIAILPVLITMCVVACAYVLRKYSVLKYIALAVVLLIFTQGGGVTTHILNSKDTWYWQNRHVIRANHAAKRILQPIVIE